MPVIRKTLFGKSLKLKQQMMIIGFLVLFVPILILSVFFIQRTGQVILEQNTQQARNSVMQISERLRSDLQLAENLADLVYLNSALQKALLRQYDNPGEVSDVYQDILFPVLRQNRYLHKDLFEVICIHTDNPTFLENGTEVRFATSDITAQPWYSQSIQRAYKGNRIWANMPREGGPANARAMTYSLYRSLDAHMGRVAGVLELQLSVHRLEQLLESTDPEHQLILVSPEGYVIASNTEGLTGSFLPAADDTGSPAMTGSEAPDASGIRTYTDHAQGERMFLERTFLTNGERDAWRVISAIPMNTVFEEVNKARNTGILISALFFVILYLVVWSFSTALSRRVSQLSEKTRQVVEGELHTLLDVGANDEIGDLTVSFNHMLNHLNLLINEVYENKIQMQAYQIRQRETEFLALQNQINPHFLYNTLDAIRMHAILRDEEAIGDMLVSLSALLRYNVSRDGEDLVPVTEEIAHVRNYFNLMQIRYDNRMTLEVDMPADLETHQVLRLILQPAVENAIRHGLREKRYRGCIRVSLCLVPHAGSDPSAIHDNATADDASSSARALCIRVDDDGTGMPDADIITLNRKLDGIADEEPEGGSIGLVNVNNRIKLRFGSAYGLSLHPVDGGGVRVNLILPVMKGGALDVQVAVGG